jgi:hypothetical protein
MHQMARVFQDVLVFQTSQVLDCEVSELVLSERKA